VSKPNNAEAAQVSPSGTSVQTHSTNPTTLSNVGKMVAIYNIEINENCPVN